MRIDELAGSDCACTRQLQFKESQPACAASNLDARFVD
jgi:hypothetical protein